MTDADLNAQGLILVTYRYDDGSYMQFWVNGDDSRFLRMELKALAVTE